MIYNYYIYLQFITVYSYRENLFALSVVERTHFQTVVNIPFISHHKKVLIVKVLSFCLFKFVMRHSKFLYSSTKLYKKVVKGDTQKKRNKYLFKLYSTYSTHVHSVTLTIAFRTLCKGEATSDFNVRKVFFPHALEGTFRNWRKLNYMALRWMSHDEL